MRRSSIFVLALSLLTASVLPAMADTINFVGTDVFDTVNVGTSAGFYTTFDSTTLGPATGQFSVYPSGTGYSQFNINFAAPAFGTPNFLTNSGGNYLFFTPESLTESYVGGFLSITEDGIISETGYAPTAGIFLLSSQGTPIDLGTTFSASLTTVPEPTSVALLGTGLLGFAGMVRRKLMA